MDLHKGDFVKMDKKGYTDKKLVGGAEGCSIYSYESANKCFLLIDSSTLLSLLSEEDSRGISGERILEFSSEEERQNYLKTIPYYKGDLNQTKQK